MAIEAIRAKLFVQLFSKKHEKIKKKKSSLFRITFSAAFFVRNLKTYNEK